MEPTPLSNIFKYQISAKEIWVVNMLLDGKTARQISIETGCNKRTVEARLSSLRKKTGVKTTPQLIAFLFRNKIIS